MQQAIHPGLCQSALGVTAESLRKFGGAAKIRGCNDWLEKKGAAQ
jgi:hypothetical protein